MSVESWKVIYGRKTTEELEAMLTELDKISNLSTQTVGSKSYGVDVGAIRQKMQAITEIILRRGGAQGATSKGVVDFSGGVDGSWGGLE